MLRLFLRKRPRPWHASLPRPPCCPCPVLPIKQQQQSQSFSTHPSSQNQEGDQENNNEEFSGAEGSRGVTTSSPLQEERTALGKALLDPAWMHGRRRIAAPPREGIEKMNDLSRLLSGKQIRLHASRINRRRSGNAEEEKTKKRRGKKKTASAGNDEDEDEEWDSDNEVEDVNDDDDENEDEEEEEEEDAPLEGEGGKIGYSMGKPTWTGKVASPPEALSYLSTRAVPNFSINLRVLREVAASAAASPPRSILDVGSGPGSGLLAAQSIWPEMQRLEGVDHSGAMRDLTKHLLGVKGNTALSSSITLHRHLPPLLAQANRSGQKYDVVFASWTLSEFPSEASRALATSLMWELVAEEGGYLVLIEDGSPEGSRLVRSARKLVLTEAKTDAKARTVGPCPHDKPCPLARHDWCRFSQRVPIGRVQRGAGKPGLGYKDVAFSYVILQKNTLAAGSATSSSLELEGDHDELRQKDGRLAALHRLRYGDSREEDGAEAFPYQPKDQDWEVAVDAIPQRDGWGRLIRNPKKAKGHVLLDMCTPKGKLERVIVAKGASKPLPGKYMAARKAQWGGLWPFPDV